MFTMFSDFDLPLSESDSDANKDIDFIGCSRAKSRVRVTYELYLLMNSSRLILTSNGQSHHHENNYKLCNSWAVQSQDCTHITSRPK